VTGSTGAIVPAETYSYERRNLYLVQNRLAALREFVESRDATVANSSVLLLAGEAGTGKTHMFCDIAQRRARAGAPTLLFLAEQFVPGEPWKQMLDTLGLVCDRDQFLGALEAVAEAHGTRSLILIDGLNEEHGQQIWPKYLAGMINELKRHPRIGLAISVRTSYESSVISGQLKTEGRVTRFVHSGFEGTEDEAVDRYFAHYGITMPSFPILDPEFSNPLFLRVLCEGVQNSGLSRIPEGLTGFTAVFQFFLDSVHAKLARPNLLDFDEQRPVVAQAIERVVTAMLASETDWLERDSASQLIEAVLPRGGFDRSLFRRLLDEGVLTEELLGFRGKGISSRRYTSIRVVRFQYQRFADHLIARHLFEPHLREGTPEAAFDQGRHFGRILADPVACRRNQGVVEALALLVPERTGMELPALVPRCSSFSEIKAAVSGSLVWRRADSISSDTWLYIEREILGDGNARRTFLRTLVLVAPDSSLGIRTTPNSCTGGCFR
jgi:hypothetical protein